MTGKRKARTIVEFVRDKRKVDCPVCAVPQAVRDEMNAARRSGFTISVILEWLKSERGIVLTPEQSRFHYGGMHEGTKTAVRSR